jgi:putative transcriptional regulator
MSRKAPTYGARLIQGANEAVAIARGRKSPRVTQRALSARTGEVSEPPVYNAAKVKRIRKKLNMSQTVFARTLNASDATVRAWEQGKRVPDGPSQRLLEVAEKHPHVFASVVRERRPTVKRASKR